MLQQYLTQKFWNQVKPILAKDSIDLQITEFTDYNTPNLALGDKEIDANFFQHVPYMDEFAKAHNLPLVSVGSVHLEPMGLYSRQIKDLKDLPKGAKIAIPMTLQTVVVHYCYCKKKVLSHWKTPAISYLQFKISLPILMVTNLLN